jgi:hypothetical protein
MGTAVPTESTELSSTRAPVSWHPVHVIKTVAATMGLRLDRAPIHVLITAAGILLSAVLSFKLTDTHLANILGTTSHKPLLMPSVVYVAGTFVVYYIGHTLFYVLGLHRAMRARLGDQRAYALYSTVLGIVFFNIFWSQIPFLAALSGTLPFKLPALPLAVTSLAMIASAYAVKVWATLVLGVDGYYYRDMFLEERSEGGPLTTGPYALFSDPMYSIGYLPIYGAALFSQSLEGLLVGALFHAGIFVFDRIVERPFVRRMYGSA